MDMPGGGGGDASNRTNNHDQRQPRQPTATNANLDPLQPRRRLPSLARVWAAAPPCQAVAVQRTLASVCFCNSLVRYSGGRQVGRR